MNTWHIQFHDSGKGLFVEGFTFRTERLRVLKHISYDELFDELHWLGTGRARWCW